MQHNSSRRLYRSSFFFYIYNLILPPDLLLFFCPFFVVVFFVSKAFQEICLFLNVCVCLSTFSMWLNKTFNKNPPSTEQHPNSESTLFDTKRESHLWVRVISCWVFASQYYIIITYYTLVHPGFNTPRWSLLQSHIRFDLVMWSFRTLTTSKLIKHQRSRDPSFPFRPHFLFVSRLFFFFSSSLPSFTISVHAVFRTVSFYF